jgi:hypothetical protein
MIGGLWQERKSQLVCCCLNYVSFLSNKVENLSTTPSLRDAFDAFLNFVICTCYHPDEAFTPSRRACPKPVC